MASVSLKNIKKVYPNEEKKKKAAEIRFLFHIVCADDAYLGHPFGNRLF